MKFKAPHMKDQYDRLPVMLKAICEEFEYASLEFRVEPVVTRVSDPVAGESGVHRDNRAVDFRFETSDGVKLYTENEAKTIVERVNDRYPRSDGKKTCILHSFQGGPKHFHVQIPIGWV